MAKCAVCDKGAHFGLKVSHSNRKSNKMWKSNVKSVKVLTGCHEIPHEPYILSGQTKESTVAVSQCLKVPE